MACQPQPEKGSQTANPARLPGRQHARYHESGTGRSFTKAGLSSPHYSRIRVRAYDYRTVVSQGGINWESSTPAALTARTFLQFGDWPSEIELFLLISPDDLYVGTIDADAMFAEDYETLNRFMNGRVRSLFANAGFWREDVEQLVSQMDRFIIHVSAFTPSLFWELELLRTRGRSRNSVVMLDTSAISVRYDHEFPDDRTRDYLELGRGAGTRREVWSGARSLPDVSIEDFRGRFGNDFDIMETDDVLGQLQHLHKAERVFEWDGESRGQPLNFRFSPHLPSSSLARLSDYRDLLQAYVSENLETGVIEDVDWFLNRLDLYVFICVLLGDTSAAGEVLAWSSFSMQAVVARAAEALYPSSADSAEPAMRERETEKRLELLDAHSRVTEYVAMKLLLWGSVTEFDNRTSQAEEVFNRGPVIFDAVASAIERNRRML